jgi:hypothetical protein
MTIDPNVCVKDAYVEKKNYIEETLMKNICLGKKEKNEG